MRGELPNPPRGEAFSSSWTVARAVRVVYCHACGSVSTNVWGEREICTRCGHSAEPMTYRRPWQSYASAGILLAAAALFLFGPIQDGLLRGLIFIGVLAVAVALSSWGLEAVRKQVLGTIAARSAAEGKT